MILTGNLNTKMLKQSFSDSIFIDFFIYHTDSVRDGNYCKSIPIFSNFDKK
jgi:hypothetical protein